MPKEQDPLEVLKDYIKIQKQPGIWNYDPYLFGFTNGLILAYATMTDTKVEYLDSPNEWLSEKHIRSKKSPLAPTTLTSGLAAQENENGK